MTPPIYRSPDPSPEYRGPTPLRPQTVEMSETKAGRSVHRILAAAVLVLFAGLIALALLFGLSHCGGTLPPIQCPPICLTPLPTSTPVPVPSATPKPSVSPSPAHSATATATRPLPTASPVATGTATPTPGGTVQFLQSTGGRDAFSLDLAGFTPISGLDAYAFATACWSEPDPPHAAKTICAQLGLRGTKMPPCEKKPCEDHMAVEVRASANWKYDGQDMDPNTPGIQYRPESQMCGEGTRPSQWIPLGVGGPVYTILLEYGPAFGDGIFVSTPGGRANLTQGMRNPGFGWWVEGVPCDVTGTRCGVGALYKKAWTVQAHGGVVILTRSEIIGPQPILSRCP